MAGTKKKATTLSVLKRAVAKDIASLKANHKKELAALMKPVAAAKKNAAAEIAKLKKAIGQKSASKKR